MRMLRSAKLHLFQLAQSVWGTSVQEWRWRLRHFVEPEETLQHPRRSHLVRDHLLAYAPLSLLEVGCNSGVTLRLIAQMEPGVELSGVDVNREAIALGRRLAPDIDLRVASVRSLPFPDKRFDVVFTDALFLYVGPDSISSALAECLRVAKKAVVVREWGAHPTRSENGCWLHDWHALGAARLDSAYPQSVEWEHFGVIAHFPKSTE